MVVAEACIPKWYKGGNRTCPYGTALPGDITWPNEPHFFDYVAIIYGALPYFVVLLSGLELLVKRGTRQLSLVLFTLANAVVNEITVKPFIALPRPGYDGLLVDDEGTPIGSCVVKCGMPSSHAAMSMGTLMLIFCDGVHRVVPCESRNGIREMPGFLLHVLVTTPVAQENILTPSEFACIFLFWSMVLLPVPLMRIRLHDHNVNQVVVGSLMGLIYGSLWHLLVRFLTMRYRDRLFQPCCGGFLVHNYRPMQLRMKDKGGFFDKSHFIWEDEVQTSSVVEMSTTSTASLEHNLQSHV
mmetsp:Transcript_127158/g.354072  ORF Transcript_127158/g.354072 Transcript_127158/m.354072 type:complete len:298 (-) Transcript_127158:89-982(-)